MNKLFTTIYQKRKFYHVGKRLVNRKSGRTNGACSVRGARELRNDSSVFTHTTRESGELLQKGSSVRRLSASVCVLFSSASHLVRPHRVTALFSSQSQKRVFVPLRIAQIDIDHQSAVSIVPRMTHERFVNWFSVVMWWGLIRIHILVPSIDRYQ
jgi:hypothetical protein